MPPEEFLKTFFPLDKISQETKAEVFKVGCYKDTVQAVKERLAYGPFVSPLNGRPQPALTIRLDFKIKTTETFMPGFSAVDSSNYPDCHQSSKFPFKVKPDISVYASCKPPIRLNWYQLKFSSNLSGITPMIHFAMIPRRPSPILQRMLMIRWVKLHPM